MPIVGTLHAIASSAARPKDSISLGISIRSASGNSSLDVVLLADEVDSVLNVVLASEIFGDAPIRAIADQHQASRHRLRDASEDLDDVLNSLHGPKV